MNALNEFYFDSSNFKCVLRYFCVFSVKFSQILENNWMGHFSSEGSNTYPSLCHFNGGGIEVYTGSNGEALKTHGHYSKII